MLEHFADAFIPHGHCYLWRPGLLWLHVISDGLTALAYFSIPFALFFFVRQRHDLTFRWVFLMFGLFILSCGLTHLMNVWNVWNPDYWAAGILKAITAASSIATAWLLWPLLPKALALPSPAALAYRQRELEREISERRRAENALQELNAELEARVGARTADLERQIAERKEIEAALQAAKVEAEQANNAKSRFLAAASHDLRQPLSALNLYIDVLRSKAAASDLPLFNDLKQCASSLNGLLSDLLDLSKLDAGVVRPNISSFPVRELLDNLVAVFEPEARLKGIRLRRVASSLTVSTDPVLLRRMVGNLVSNAVRYTPRGSVLIGCRRRQGKTWLEVWDTGVGIAPGKIDEIFEEFKQLDEARSRGSGLGLAIVKKTAALLGLEVRVASRPGRGSMFAIELPRGVASEARPPEHRQSRPLRIALVEDNLRVRNALEVALIDAGHEVIPAGSRAELLARLGREALDVVVSDYRLSEGETGFAVITAMREAFGETLPAILITGDTDPGLLRSMATSGIVVQHKPLELDGLLACLAAIVPVQTVD